MRFLSQVKATGEYFPLPPPTTKYYAECCAKGGVAIQLCRWTRGIHLVTGNIDDSKYTDISEILKQQLLHQQHDTKPGDT